MNNACASNRFAENASREYIAAPASGEQRIHRNPRLLLAENAPSNQEFLCEFLSADYDIEAVANGEQAWEAARRELPDLILSDVRMPGLDGIGLTRQLRADTRTDTVPIILLTAHDEDQLLIEGLEAGADD